jgi:hypothetical protein
VAAGDPAAAAEILASTRRREAETHLGMALAFHRSVGATAYAARAEALLRSTA